MSDAAPAKKAEKKTPKKKVPVAHPKYVDMIAAAIGSLKERSGSSRQAILKYVTANYKVSDSASTHVKLALKRGVAGGALKQVKGSGASGSFKLADKPKAPKKKAQKKPAAKKPAAKKTPKKATKKPAAAKKATPKKKAAKKTPKKVVKKATTPKKAAAAKKPAAKKPAKKVVKKKAAPKKK